MANAEVVRRRMVQELVWEGRRRIRASNTPTTPFTDSSTSPQLDKTCSQPSLQLFHPKVHTWESCAFARYSMYDKVNQTDQMNALFLGRCNDCDLPGFIICTSLLPCNIFYRRRKIFVSATYITHSDMVMWILKVNLFLFVHVLFSTRMIIQSRIWSWLAKLSVVLLMTKLTQSIQQFLILF